MDSFRQPGLLFALAVSAFAAFAQNDGATNAAPPPATNAAPPAASAMATSAAWEPDVLVTNACRVADWALAHPRRADRKNWTYGAFYAGLAAFGLSDRSMRYLDVVRDEGEKYGWRLNGRPFHADDHCIGQPWLEIAIADDDPAALEPVQFALDYVLANRSRQPIVSKSFKTIRQNYDRWCWADALFMAPPVWARLASLTGDARYRDFMISEYRATMQRLYDEEDCLFLRDARFAGKTSANGRKTFWSRGCGWVFAGLPLVLREMPPSAETRPIFEKLFTDMAAALKSCQRPDGSWGPNLLDPASPDKEEMSGTAFFCYGMAWGVNNGLLDAAEYVPAVKRAWTAMCRNVSADGRFGNVQQAGDRPSADYGPDSTEVYAAGAYLLAATEIRKHVVAAGHPDTKSLTLPPLPSFCATTVAVPLKDLGFSVPYGLVAWDLRDGAALPCQPWSTKEDGVLDAIVFPATLHADVPAAFKVFRSFDLRPPSASAMPTNSAFAGFSFAGAKTPAASAAVESCRTLASGPVRSVVERRFAPVELANGATVRETRRTTLERGVRFATHVSTFEISGAPSVRGGPAIALGGSGENAKVYAEPARGWLAVAKPADKDARRRCEAVTTSAPGASLTTTDAGDLALAAEIANGGSMTWRSAAIETAASFSAWQAHVRRIAATGTNAVSAAVK